MVRLREILDGLGYAPIETAKFMHFQKAVPQGYVRVELLTGPIDPAQHRVQIKGPRVRPRGNVELHAYLTDEAVAFDVEPLVLALEDGASVSIPNAFSFLVMKLHACWDRIDDDNKQLGRHHALDVYRILAMLTESEDQLARALRRAHHHAPGVRRAAEIAGELFGDTTSRGVLRMREHALASADMQVEQALELLRDLMQSTG